ncbi:phage tail protein [Escherichia marmotae]|nr:phage tail protein [Escherichia marmotae]
MTAKYFAILTNQGAARLANAAALGTKLNLTQMAVGDANGTLPTPDPAQTKLINQKRIAPLNQLTVDPANTSQIIAEQIIPENEGGFWIREIGLYDTDGILIAVANCPETYKPQLQEGSGRTQTIRMILIVSSTSAITLKIDPSVVLATRKYADDKAIELKLYVDDLMSKHLAAADPHSQYATKDSPTFTGKPRAPTPPVVANDTQVATAEFVRAVIAALVSGELANKQPLDKTLTDLSGKDVAAILEYLGLTDSTYGLKNYINISAVGVTNWEVPDVLKNGRKAFVRVIGAGGGGAIGNLSSTSGGGGGGSGIAEGLVDLTGIATVSITVGQGGSAATTISSNGGSGGSSSFGTYMSATGGSGGGQPSGGPSGVGVGATNISSLGPGSPGAVIDSTNSALLQSIPGGSGGGPGGYGASATTSTNIAADAVAPGGGGAGLKPTLSTGVRAGKGANGIVIIYW